MVWSKHPGTMIRLGVTDRHFTTAPIALPPNIESLRAGWEINCHWNPTPEADESHGTSPGGAGSRISAILLKRFGSCFLV